MDGSSRGDLPSDLPPVRKGAGRRVPSVDDMMFLLFVLVLLPPSGSPPRSGPSLPTAPSRAHGSDAGPGPGGLVVLLLIFVVVVLPVGSIGLLMFAIESGVPRLTPPDAPDRV